MVRFAKRRLFRWLVKIFQLRDSAESVGHGLALGVFVGIAVPWGLQFTVAFVLAWALGINRMASMVGTNITNFFTVGPIYFTSYWVGRLLLGLPPHKPDFHISSEIF